MLSCETNIEYGIQIQYSMNEIWKNTPIDMIDKIVRYTGKMRLRNGLFMNQINKEDIRYVVLQTIPEKFHTYDPISNTHTTYVFFNSYTHNMRKIIVKYENKSVLHTVFNYFYFNACIDWI